MTAPDQDEFDPTDLRGDQLQYVRELEAEVERLHGVIDEDIVTIGELVIENVRLEAAEVLRVENAFADAPEKA